MNFESVLKKIPGTLATTLYFTLSAYFFFVLGCSVYRRPPTNEESTSQPSEPTLLKRKPSAVSFYGDEFSGKKTASGERFNPQEFTAAHRTLPFGTKVKLKNPENGKEVEVRVNDRGPFVKGREFDISKSAAQALGVTDDGVAKLESHVVAKD